MSYYSPKILYRAIEAQKACGKKRCLTDETKYSFIQFISPDIGDKGGFYLFHKFRSQIEYVMNIRN